MNLRYVPWFLPLLLLAGCESAITPPGAMVYGVIEGVVVRSEGGAVLPNATVWLYYRVLCDPDAGLPVQRTTTDSAGRFREVVRSGTGPTMFYCVRTVVEAETSTGRVTVEQTDTLRFAPTVAEATPLDLTIVVPR